MVNSLTKVLNEWYDLLFYRLTFEKIDVLMFAKASEERVFRYLYERRSTSKQLIARDLCLSLPTVTHALTTLMDEGLVERKGTFPSTGGRPADVYALRTNARHAIGVEVVAGGVRAAFVDLVGNIVAQDTLELPFEHSEAYRKTVDDFIDAVAFRPGLPHGQLLGVTLAIQGIVSRDNRVVFGGLLGQAGTDVSLEDFAPYARAPLFLAHDAEAAAYAEIWRHRELDNFAYLSLNDHLGSALVREGRLLHSNDYGAGVAEHMVAVPLGEPCCCGNRGCYETLLGAKALKRRASTSIPRFFERLRTRNPDALQLWNTYLDHLAQLIHNLRMAACGDVVIGGRLSRYMTQGDLRALRMKLTSMGALSRRNFHLLFGHYRDEATALGAGIMVIERYLSDALD